MPRNGLCADVRPGRRPRASPPEVGRRPRCWRRRDPEPWRSPSESFIVALEATSPSILPLRRSWKMSSPDAWTSISLSPQCGEGTPQVTGFFEVMVAGKLVHSKKGGDGYVDTEVKFLKLVAAIKAALAQG
ncbi:selenoprotein W isoform X2 [Equus asinus]|uniref:selenoprotein W isoform X2 n=1 Tax=Equus asinus TaxID=9793 RepID=UPI0038F6B60C